MLIFSALRESMQQSLLQFSLVLLALYIFEGDCLKCYRCDAKSNGANCTTVTEHTPTMTKFASSLYGPCEACEVMISVFNSQAVLQRKCMPQGWFKPNRRTKKIPPEAAIVLEKRRNGELPHCLNSDIKTTLVCDSDLCNSNEIDLSLPYEKVVSNLCGGAKNGGGDVATPSSSPEGANGASSVTPSISSPKGANGASSAAPVEAAAGGEIPKDDDDDNNSSCATHRMTLSIVFVFAAGAIFYA